MQEIPLSGGAANAHQTFTIKLGDNVVDFEVNYLSYVDTPAWSVDISRDGSYLMCGMMLVPDAEVSKNYGAGIGRFFFVGDEPTLDNLGENNHLLWIPE